MASVTALDLELVTIKNLVTLPKVPLTYLYKGIVMISWRYSSFHIIGILLKEFEYQPIIKISMELQST